MEITAKFRKHPRIRVGLRVPSENVYLECGPRESFHLAKPRTEIPGLTGMRGLAATYVLLFHYIGESSKAPGWLFWFTQDGWSGVNFFFLLSGFLLATIYSKPTKQYFVRRVFRTFPLYYASLPLYAIAGFIVITPLHLIYAQDYFAQTFTNSALWTLTLEELFYFVLFPLILILNVKPRYLVAAGIASSFLWSFLPFTRMISEQMPNYFIAYAAGIFLARNGSTITARIRPSLRITLIVVGVFLLTDALVWVFLGGDELAKGQPLVYSATYGLVILFMRDSILFTNRISIFLGRISYGIYILTMPILWIVAHPGDVLYLGPAVLSLHLNIYLAVPLAGLITLAAATISYYAFESPLISLGRRLTSS